MGTRSYLLICLENLSCFIDEIADSFGIFCVDVITSSIRETNDSLGVAEKQKRKPKFFGKDGIVVNRIEADAKNLGIPRAKFFDLIVKPTTFNCSSRGVGFRIEPQ